MNIIKNRYWYFLISLLVHYPGPDLHGHPLGTETRARVPLPLGIDFNRRLPLLEVQFCIGHPADKPRT